MIPARSRFPFEVRRIARLIVRFFGGEPVGTVVREADGALQVGGQTPEPQRLLSDLIEQIRREPVFLLTGGEKSSEEGWRRVMVRRTCFPDDPDYLKALGDILFRSKASLLNRRIQGEVEE